MIMKKKSNAAEVLTRHINSAKPKLAPKITDEFAQAVGRRLESRRIASVPGLPQDEAPQWYEIALEQHARNEEHRARKEAERQAEEEARRRPQTMAGILAAAIAAQGNTTTASKHIPLNGAAVLRAALAGAPGTINAEIG